MLAKKSELKDWARENMRGFENCTMPSFTPDLKELDEEGIRLDVRQAIRHGCFSTLCTPEAGLTFEESKRFVEIVTEEAQDEILVSCTLLFDSFDRQYEMIRHCESAGCHTVLLGYPGTFRPESPNEIYAVTKELCESTNIAIVLYPSFKYNFERFHPAGFPLELLAKMADIENVVAMKIGLADQAAIAECFRLCGDKVLVNFPFEAWAPLLVQGFGQQWLGSGPMEMYQSPECRYAVDYFELLLSGEIDKAMNIFWQLTPVRQVMNQLAMRYIMLGTYHWAEWKYCQWLVGGNGGLTREPCMKLLQHNMQALRGAMQAIGLTLREPDEEFYVGRVNYAAGRSAEQHGESHSGAVANA